MGGTRDVGAELVRRLVVDACVGVAVGGGLVSPPDDFRDEVAMLRDGHPEQEEGRACLELVEQVEQSGGLALERGVRPVPVGEAETPVDELVPVLEVDREQQLRSLSHAPTLDMPRTSRSDPGCNEGVTLDPQAGTRISACRTVGSDPGCNETVTVQQHVALRAYVMTGLMPDGLFRTQC